MNVSGPFPPVGHVAARDPWREAEPVRPRDAATGAPAPAASTTHGVPPASASPAPAGATLWEMLSADERAFFGTEELMQGLTYNRRRAARAAEPAVPTGQRVDLRA